MIAARWRSAVGMGLVALAAAALGAWIAGQRYALGPSDTEAARLLWSLELPQADGVPLRLAELQGKVLVVNFWATWCPPCVHEMPELSAIRDEFVDNGVEFVGIGIDNLASVAAFAKRVPVSYPLVVAGTQGAELSRAFGNQSAALPFTAVLDRSGRIVERRLGIVDFDRLRAELARLSGD